jgi:hypothetical protein
MVLFQASPTLGGIIFDLAQILAVHIFFTIKIVLILINLRKIYTSRNDADIRGLPAPQTSTPSAQCPAKPAQRAPHGPTSPARPPSAPARPAPAGPARACSANQSDGN